MKIYFKTFDNSRLKNIDVASLDFNCITDVKMLDINSNVEGNVNTSFKDYSYDTNRKLIEDSYNGVDFLKGVTKEEKDKAAKFPESSKCRSKSSLEENPEETKGVMTKDSGDRSIYILSGLIVAGIIFVGFKIKKVKRNI